MHLKNTRTHKLLRGAMHAAIVFTLATTHAQVVEKWVHRYNGPGNHDDASTAVAVDRAGNVVVTGFSHDAANRPNSYTAKYAAANGALVWEVRYSGPSREDVAWAVAVDGSGNVAVAGYSSSLPGYHDFYTAKYAAADGALLWEKRYNGPGNSYSEAHALAVDRAGNVVVTGYSWGGAGRDDFYTAKYAAADGALLWERRYNGPGNDGDHAQALTLDNSGNVVVTGDSWGGATRGDTYTAKYAAADGALLWEKRYYGVGYNDTPHGVAVDVAGNVAITGQSDGFLFPDYYTARYAATDGALIWEKRYNGPGNTGDVAAAVAMDRAGNVVVTGESAGIGTSSDYYTAKYAAADGTLLWEKRYDGPGNSFDFARALAMDRAGNVVVSGYSIGSVNNYDYYTAKYAARDGALLWEKRYDGPAHGYEVLYGLALTPRGGAVITGISDSGTILDRNYDIATIQYAATDPIHAVLFARGEALPGAGRDPRIPAGATWHSFGVPSIDAEGKVTFAARWMFPKKSRTGFGAGHFVDGALRVAGTDSEDFCDRSAAESQGREMYSADDASQKFHPGDAAPGGGVWKTLTPLGCPGDDAGLYFSATLARGVDGIDSTNDRGVWGVDGAGELRLLFREGVTTIDGRTLKSFAVHRAGRAFNSSGQFVWRATFTDGASAIVETQVP